ncbi:sigma-70 family RNA polymerase sigma factor [Rubripirellula reticaptiva]|uniref:RNA polymerase sigma factor SigA n=1 Tax=Rubripirellula reticaptiva TaxID=2528013 RepID=A0A5C6F171_9BACT|nr:sigma-70 family RNA polymerase sigma factor [Rubripirellula reticaptiva]TWU55573.1 RNA polymerase sigma factor SigA [Rubripirellula reticaptiva]
MAAVKDQAEITVSSHSRGTLARAPKWLGASELAAAMAVANERILDRRDSSASVLKRATKHRLAEPIEFISNERFGDSGFGDELFAEPLDLQDRNSDLGVSRIRKASFDLPIHLGRLCEAPLLTPEQERRLFCRMNYLRHQAAYYQSMLNPQRPSRVRLELVDRLLAMADWHRDQIVEANLRLVFSIVKKFVNQTNSFDDLLSDGIIGMFRAVDKFDFGRGFRFSTYATLVIRRNAYRSVMETQEEQQQAIGGLQDMEIEVTDERHMSAFSEKRWHLLRSRLAGMLNSLDRREKFIIRARFALGSHRNIKTLQAIANRLGISKERVRQLELRATNKLIEMADSDSAETSS